MKALIIGGSGATGKEVVSQLLDDPAFSEIHAFGRSPLKINHEKLHTHEVDFDRPQDWAHLVQGEVAFSCLGTTLKSAGSKEAQKKIDVDYQYNFAKSAKENGVEDFILISAYGANANSNVFYSRIKGQLERKIKELHFEKLTIFQPGMLEREDSDRFGEVVGGKVIKFLNNFGILKSQKPLPTEILAKAMINASKIKSKSFSVIQLGSIFSFAKKTV